MKKIFICLLIVFFSCKNDKVKVEKIYKSGKIYKEIFYEKNIDSYDSIFYYKDEKIETKIFSKDSLSNFYVNYYSNGNIESEGFKVGNKFIGEWEFYKPNGKLDKILEYIIVCDSSYLNQGRFFDSNGNILLVKSNFYEVEYKPESSVNEKIKFSFKYIRMYDSSNVDLFISNEIESSFCNLDTKKYLIDSFNGENIIANIGYSTTGKKNLRGFIQEYLPLENYDLNEDSLKPVRVVYFDLPILVK